MQQFCFALDLKNDPEKIEAYKAYHTEVWPEIVDSIRTPGITKLDIFNVGDRLFMIMEATDEFSLEEKGKMDAANPKVQEWESLMDQFQQRLPFAKEGEKWVLMEKIFELPA